MRYAGVFCLVIGLLGAIMQIGSNSHILYGVAWLLGSVAAAIIGIVYRDNNYQFKVIAIVGMALFISGILVPLFTVRTESAHGRPRDLRSSLYYHELSS